MLKITIRGKSYLELRFVIIIFFNHLLKILKIFIEEYYSSVTECPERKNVFSIFECGYAFSQFINGIKLFFFNFSFFRISL